MKLHFSGTTTAVVAYNRVARVQQNVDCSPPNLHSGKLG